MPSPHLNSSPGYNTAWLYGDTIYGPVTVQGFTGNFINIEGNHILGGLNVAGNALTGIPTSSTLGAWYVDGNTIWGNASCSANSPGGNAGPPPPNTVFGLNTCG